MCPSPCLSFMWYTPYPILLQDYNRFPDTVSINLLISFHLIIQHVVTEISEPPAAPGESTAVINPGALQSCRILQHILITTCCCDLNILCTFNIYFSSPIFSQQSCTKVPWLYINRSCFHGGTIPVQWLHRVKVNPNPNHYPYSGFIGLRSTLTLTLTLTHTVAS